MLTYIFDLSIEANSVDPDQEKSDLDLHFIL